MPHMSRPLVAVGGVVFRGEKVLLVRRKHPPNQDRWAIPGGKVEFGETLRDALRREMKEETNLDVEPRVLMAVVEVLAEGYHYVFWTFSARRSRIAHAFLRCQGGQVPQH